MFEQSLVESTTLLRSRNRWPLAASFAGQAAIAAALIALPLLHPEMLPIHAPTLSLLPPLPRPPQPPPPQPTHVEATSSSATHAPTAPTSTVAIIRGFLHPSEPSSDSPALVGTLNMGDPNGSPTGIWSGTSPAGPSVAVASTPRANSAPARISSGVSTGLLLAPIRPEYPQIARLTRMEGIVVVQAIISKTGRIEIARALSGPVMLQGAALEAVRNARYRPYLLNNEPTEVETTITINFHLGT